MNVYCPPNIRIEFNQLKSVIDQFAHPKLIVGDFNSQHPLWGSDISNIMGNHIYNILDNNDILILNDGSPTRFTSPLLNKSCPDISVISVALSPYCTWSTMEDTGSSDHFPIQISISGEGRSQSPSYLSRENVSKLNVKGCNWDSYHVAALNKLNKWGSISNYSEFERFLSEVVQENVPVRKPYLGKNPKPPTPWWDNECNNILCLRKEKLKKLRANASIENFVECKRVMALSKFVFKNKKKASFVKFCNNLNRNTTMGEVWKTVKRFGSSINRPNCKTVSIAEMVAVEMLDGWDQASIGLTPSEFCFTPGEGGGGDPPFSLLELEYALKDKRDTSPGMDNVYYSMIKNLPVRAKELLLGMYNRALFGHEIPYQWKRTKILPLLKPDHQSGNVKSYRPISLNSCVGKVLETVIKNRIEWDLENRSWFPGDQMGFRSGKGSLECLSTLTLCIKP